MLRNSTISGLVKIRRISSISSSTSSQVPQIFDRQMKRRQRDIAALNAETSRTADYLHDEVAERIADRLLVRDMT